MALEKNEARQRLTIVPRECTGHSKHSLPTTQEMALTHEHHQMASSEDPVQPKIKKRVIQENKPMLKLGHGVVDDTQYEASGYTTHPSPPCSNPQSL